MHEGAEQVLEGGAVIVAQRRRRLGRGAPADRAAGDLEAHRMAERVGEHPAAGERPGVLADGAEQDGVVSLHLLEGRGRIRKLARIIYLADRIVLMMAKRGSRWIAGAINFLGSDTLYGRHWGAVRIGFKTDMVK